MQRYISSNLDSPRVSESDIHHIIHVMRQRKGDHFQIIFDKKVYEMEIVNLSPFDYRIVDIDSTNNELENDITIFYCLSKGDKNEFIIQKATELGVKRIVLLSSSRSVIKMDNETFNKKKERYLRIIKEASEQSRRNVTPSLEGIYPITHIPSHLLNDINLVAYENDSGNTKETFSLLEAIDKQSVSILIGSEGGISKEEIETLCKQGFKTISLGKRILRTETAAIYALSVIAFLLERK